MIQVKYTKSIKYIMKWYNRKNELYIQNWKGLRAKITELSKNIALTKLMRIAKEDGARQAVWCKWQVQFECKHERDNYDTITEYDRAITNPVEAKHHIAN